MQCVAPIFKVLPPFTVLWFFDVCRLAFPPQALANFCRFVHASPRTKKGLCSKRGFRKTWDFMKKKKGAKPPKQQRGYS